MKLFARANRAVVAVVFALMAIVAPLAPGIALADGRPTQPYDWQLWVGASTADQAVQANFFVPRQISIHVGDSVTWTWKAGEIHTVSFLNGGAPTWPGGAFAPNGANPAVYDGTAQISSGVRTSAVPGVYTVQFTRQGNFQFNCLIHSTMSGVVHVAERDEELPHGQSWYTQQEQLQTARLLQRGRQVEAQGLRTALRAGPDQVNVGYGELESTGSFAILRFQPTNRWVKVGSTVTFTVRDPETPHSVTFGQDVPPDMRIPPAGLAVLGAGFDPNTQTISSGILSLQSLAPLFTFRGPTFQVKFTKAGDYQYKCLLHDDLGMTAWIHVR